MVRFSLEEEGNPVGKKRIRGGGSGEKVCGSASTKKDKKRRDEGEAVPDRDEEEDMCVEEEEEEEEEEEKGGDEVDEGVIGEERGQPSGDGNVCVRMDPDILDCSICYEPLRPPIFQCQSGHVACSSCCSKLLNKCHLCSQSIGYNRCLILEKVIESIKIACSYAKYGCRKAMSYADKDVHEETCIYAPCSCPVPTCSFCGSREMLSAHFINTHTIFCERFSYNQIFKVEFHKTDPFRALYGKDGHLFLLLNNSVANVGNALSMACFRPRSLKHEFLYELTTDEHNSSSLQLKSSITEWKAVYPMKVFLLVPSDLYTPVGKIVLNVCIRKIKRASIK